ncbi:hypothetical protein GH733_004108 [Mirounga leonina]|nr:hypothetical protein GH733_004108 [Mirounga leonina]
MKATSWSKGSKLNENGNGNENVTWTLMWIGSPSRIYHEGWKEDPETLGHVSHSRISKHWKPEEARVVILLYPNPILPDTNTDTNPINPSAQLYP